MTAEQARRLRRNQTEVEKRLWHSLRNRQIAGCKFKRQAQIGRYVVDFACFEHGLVIELDGGQHAVAINADRRRTDWLHSEGFQVLRFWNNEVTENLEGVLRRIEAELRPPSPLTLPAPEAPGPSLSHKGRGDDLED